MGGRHFGREDWAGVGSRGRGDSWLCFMGRRGAAGVVGDGFGGSQKGEWGVGLGHTGCRLGLGEEGSNW